MAVVPDATTTVSAADVIYDEWISPIARATLNRTITVYSTGVLRVPLIGTNSNTYDHTLRDEVAVATTLAETEEVVSTEITRAKLSVSTSTLAIATFISKQANRRSLWQEMSIAAEELTSSCARALDAQFLALATGFTAPIGSNATNMTVEFLVELFTTWRARVGATMETPLLVLDSGAMGQLQKDAVNNAAAWFGTDMGVALYNSVSGLNRGVTTSFGGVEMISTSGLPAGGVTGKTNMMIARGMMEAAIAMPFEQDIQLEVWYEAKRQGWWVIATVDAGFGKVNDLAGQGVITAP
jgi:hypothetical protein